MPENIRKKILRNTTFNFFARIIHLSVSLFTIPVIVAYVGESRYGIWAALFAFADYFNMLDMGFGAATVKYTADFYAIKNIRRIGEMLTTALIFYLITVSVTIFPFCFAGNIVSFFKVPPAYFDEAVFILKGVLLLFVLNQITGVFRNALNGLQRMDIQNLFEISYTILYAAIVILVLKSGMGLKGLIVSIGVLRTFTAIGQSLCVIKLIPEIKDGFGIFNQEIFKSFFSYGIKLQITSVAGLFNFQLDKLLIGHFLKIEMVAFYELGSKIAMFVRYIPSVLTSALIPASAELSTVGDRERLKQMHLRGAKYIIFVAAPIAIFLIIMAPSVLMLWINLKDYSHAVLALRLLSVAYFFNIITGVITSIGRGIGMVHYEMYTSLLIVLMNLILSLSLIITMGFIGALIGTVITMIIGNMFYIYMFSRYIETPFVSFIRHAAIKPLFAGALAAASICICQQYIIVNHLLTISTNRATLTVFLLVAGIIFFLVYFCGLILLKFIDKFDVELLKSIGRR
jgi:O-antigen/teichoic acid export membrane protein